VQHLHQLLTLHQQQGPTVSRGPDSAQRATGTGVAQDTTKQAALSHYAGDEGT